MGTNVKIAAVIIAVLTGLTVLTAINLGPQAKQLRVMNVATHPRQLITTSDSMPYSETAFDKLIGRIRVVNAEHQFDTEQASMAEIALAESVVRLFDPIQDPDPHLNETDYLRAVTHTPYAGCTGVLIDPHWVLTAKHCITVGNHDKPNYLTMSFGPDSWQYNLDNFTQRGKIRTVMLDDTTVMTHPTADLALVHVPFSVPNVPSAPVAQYSPAAGTASFALGFGDRNLNSPVKVVEMVTTHSITKDKIDRVPISPHSVYTPTHKMSQTDMTIVPGDSGGPIVDLTTGEVVAITALVISTHQAPKDAVAAGSHTDKQNYPVTSWNTINVDLGAPAVRDWITAQLTREN